MSKFDFIIKKEDIKHYGDDLRAVIRAFADEVNRLGNIFKENNKTNLKYIKEEIDFILKYEMNEVVK